jgi:hypothetical protein
MPHFGRELVALNELTEIDLTTSVGVEHDKSTFIAIRAVINRYFNNELPLIYGDIDDFCLKTNQEFDVAHLDYNGPLTKKHIRVINKLVKQGTLTFFTISPSCRFSTNISDVVAHTIGHPPIVGNQLLWQPYSGNKRVPMETFCYMV